MLASNCTTVAHYDPFENVFPEGFEPTEAVRSTAHRLIEKKWNALVETEPGFAEMRTEVASDEELELGEAHLNGALLAAAFNELGEKPIVLAIGEFLIEHHELIPGLIGRAAQLAQEGR